MINDNLSSQLHHISVTYCPIRDIGVPVLLKLFKKIWGVGLGEGDVVWGFNSLMSWEF